MPDRRGDLETVDRALVDLRRFLAAPDVLDDAGRRLELSTLLVLDGLPAGGQSIGEIAARLDVAHSTASRFVTRAGRAGVVRRSPAPDDPRRTVVAPTEAGTALARRATAHRLERLRALLDGWDDGDVADLARLLGRFAREHAEDHDRARR
ncbi:hypothetical protein GCM10023216_22830 [Isoptericola chiayiensis]|uniref:HTH marR-type domain-containing protein n=2 Tax=Isoptericola chiayiensis TaxID=579446 RepID=A0ABP8YIY5_9MICO